MNRHLAPLSSTFIIALMLFSCGNTANQAEVITDSTSPSIMQDFDWQGHRGARGLAPENTIPAFLKALTFPIKTLELDVVIAKDGGVIVSHEPWMSPTICLQPDGQALSKKLDEEFKIFELSTAEVQAFNCGKAHPRFPDQVVEPTFKPSLQEVIEAVESFCKEKGRKLPHYNIEIKSKPTWDGLLTPSPAIFAQLVVDVIQASGIQDRACIQSFDPRSLEAVHKIEPSITTAYLIDKQVDIQRNMSLLSYQPEIYSPNHEILTKAMVEGIHEMGMQIIPWTVNDKATMQKLINMGVDGIITDYPNYIPEL